MFDHVTIRVADRDASDRFYETVLTPLGIDNTYRTDVFSFWNEFYVTPTSDGHPVTSGLHVAFVAPTRQQVDDFWKEGTAAGYRDDGAPGPRPEYREDYYGAFLRDPDGNSVEAVHHGALARSGKIDHIWIRVADLAATTAFYRLIAPASGFGVVEATADRTTFEDRQSGQSFSLVSGDALTKDLHVAFSGHDADVHRFHRDATAAGYRDNGAPGERPRYHRGYYAAFVLDPDGNNIEVVDHHRG